MSDRQSRSLLPRPHLVLEYLILTDLMSNTNNKLPRTLRQIIEYLLNRDHFNTSICHLLKELANRFQILSVLLYYYICPILFCSVSFTNIRCSSSQIPFYTKINACPFVPHIQDFFFYHCQKLSLLQKLLLLFYLYFINQ